MAAARGELEAWLGDPEGALALLLLLDQIPRNIFRDSAHSWATDGLARHYANRAIEAGHDQAFDVALRAFFYLPFEHSEDLADQERSVALFEAADDKTFMSYAIGHREAIRKFGRFPHRNAALGRVNTAEEQAWLDAGGGRPSAVCSSPLEAICSMMSQPPTSSPPMYSCGIVGQSP